MAKLVSWIAPQYCFCPLCCRDPWPQGTSHRSPIAVGARFLQWSRSFSSPRALYRSSADRDRGRFLSDRSTAPLAPPNLIARLRWCTCSHPAPSLPQASCCARAWALRYSSPVPCAFEHPEWRLPSHSTPASRLAVPPTAPLPRSLWPACDLQLPSSCTPCRQLRRGGALLRGGLSRPCRHHTPTSHCTGTA